MSVLSHAIAGEDSALAPAVSGAGAEAALLPGRLDGLALFLDLDGTLIDIAETPDKVVVPKELPGLLRRVCEAVHGAVAIVSGRTIGTIDGLVAPVRLPAAGVHGSEIRYSDGSLHALPRVQALDRIRAELVEFVDRRPPLLLEDKVTALGVHYRADPRFEPEVEWIMRRLAASAGGELAVQPGKMVVEMRPARANKGVALESLMATPPFAGRIPVALGDDLTDEEMFSTANRLGGLSVRVGANAGVTTAKLRLGTPQDVHGWFAACLPRIIPVKVEREHASPPSVAPERKRRLGA